MPHLCCSNGIPPVTQPAPGIEGGESALELGYELGLARDPNTGVQIIDNTHAQVDLRAPYVPTIAMGVPRSMLRPADQAPDVQNRNGFDGAVGWQDTHMLFAAGASQAVGEQERMAVVQRNTWRARPTAWDAGLPYVGQSPEGR
jgi:hypothetical protein